MITPAKPTPGIAGFWSDTVGGLVELMAGDTPPVVTVSGTYTGAQGTAGIPARTPVVLDVEGGAIALVDGTTYTKANAITAHDVPAGSAAGSVVVYKAGMFNFEALLWPASFNTDAKKLAAFDLAKCQIYVKKPYYK